MTARVGLNLLWLVPDVVGGSEVSTVTTLRALVRDRPDDIDHVVVALASFADRYPDIAEAFETHTVGLHGALKGARVGVEQTWLPVMARRQGLDLVHHLGGTTSLLGGPPVCVSIHDLQPFDLPRNFHAVKRAWLGVAVPGAVRRSRIVLTPSRWVRQTVIDRFDAPPDRVVVVPHPLPELDHGTPPDELRRRYRLQGDVVVYPAITYPHKDHVTLVRAFALVAPQRDVTLVLTGGEGDAESEVRAAIAASGVADRIHRTGWVPRADVVGLVDMAEVVAIPSRYEGFGIPAVEAMARGRAVVATDTTAVPEVVGDGGLLCPPGDVEAWAATLADLLDDPAARARLGEAGRRRATAFSPEANLAGTLAAQRRALAAGP